MLRKAIVLGLAVGGAVACAQSMDPNSYPAAEPGSPGGSAGYYGGGQLAGYHTYRHIQIESNPPGALIVIDGRRFGTTPQAIRVDDDRRTIQVILSKPGYLAKGGELDLTTLTAMPCSDAASANVLCSGIHANLIPSY